MTSTEQQQAEGGLLSVLVFIAFTDNFFQLPIISPLATSLGAGPALAGMVVGAYSLTNMLGNVGAGPILDRYGYARPLTAAFAATATVLLAYPLLTMPGQLLALRLLHGLAAATLVPAIFAWRASQAGEGGEMAAMGRLGALIGAAAMVCPPLSGMLAARAGFAAPYLVLGLLFMAAAAALALRLPRTAAAWKPGDGIDVGVPRPRLLEPLARVWREAPANGLLLVWLGALAMVSCLGTLALRLPLDLTAAGAAAPTRAAGLLMGLFSTVAVLTMLAFQRARRPQDASRILAAAAAGLALLSGGAVVLGITGSTVGMAAGVAVLGLGFGVAFPALNASVGKRAVPSRRGSAFSLFYAFYSLGAVLGPLAAGLAAEWAPVSGWAYAPTTLATLTVAVVAARRALGEPPLTAKTPPGW